MVVEEVKYVEELDLVRVEYDGEYPTDEEILDVVEEFFGHKDFEIIDVDQSGSTGVAFLKKK